MSQHNIATPDRVWYDSSHASLCLLGTYLRRIGFFQPLEDHLQIQQKRLKYTPVQKLEMFLVALLAGAKAVSQTSITVGVDPALWRAFGLPGCAEQSVIAATLDAATEADVADLQAALGESIRRYSQAARQDLDKEVLVLDVDLSPLPASRHAEGSTRGYMGRCRSKTGRKLVRVRAAQSQETVWETVVRGRTAESLPVLQEALTQAERLLGLEGENEAAQAKRGRVEIRLDSGWGSTPMITWLLSRGYQVTGKFKSTGRVRKLVQGITAWYPISSPGREVAVIPEPVPFGRPLVEYAVRTPSKEHASGYYQAVLFTTRAELGMQAAIDHYDGRAGIEKRQPHYSRSTHSAVQPAWSDVLSILRVSHVQQPGLSPDTSDHAFRLQPSADVAAVTGRFQRHQPTRSSARELAPRAGHAPSRGRSNCRA